MKKYAVLIVVLFSTFFGFNSYAQTTASEPTLQETLDWLSSKCTAGVADYNDRPGVWDRQAYVSFKFDLDKRTIQYFSNEWLYLRDKADRVLFTDTYLKIHFVDLSGCQITVKKEGVTYVEIVLSSHNTCKRKIFSYDNKKHQENPNYNYETYRTDFELIDKEPDLDCNGVVIKLFYREDLVSSDRIIKAVEHLIKLTGGALEPF